MLHALILLGSQLLAADGLRSSPQSRAPETWQASDEQHARVVLEGSVLDPEGAPAQGALVVSSAGGRALVDASGRYRLELWLPRAAREVQVTAVGASGTNLLSSTRVELAVPLEVVSVGPLLLSQASGCAPGWLPTFGEAPGVFGTVYALAAFDDGGGPTLYAAGTVLGAGAVVAGRVVKWDGERWAPVPPLVPQQKP
jgi:hypothetical protein